MSHPLIALAIQLATVAAFMLLGIWAAGATAATLCYIWRETTQAEYRWIERFGDGRRANMPWWARFDPRVWSLKDLTDWIAPMVVTSIVAWMMR